MIEALPRMLRVDLIWNAVEYAQGYEVQRSKRPAGPFQTLRNPLPKLFLFSDYIGESEQTYYYRVRATGTGGLSTTGEWSEVVSATSVAYEREGFLTEVQEAGFRYSYHFAHPASNLPREGIKAVDSWGSDTISAVSTGMYFFNIAVGVERGFITRDKAVNHVFKALQFLANKADRFHGAFPHWIHGSTGQVIPFSATDDGADLVETAILAKGLIFAREYFDQANAAEAEMRTLADKLWNDIEWNHFIDNGAMAWHWSPQHGFGNLPIVGFNEAEIAYLLGIGSPMHPIDTGIYWSGWVGKNANYYNPRMVPGLEGPIKLQLGHDYGLPMFLMHYSYMGLDPRGLPTPEGSLFEEFERLTLANHDYCKLNSGRFAGYDRFWGLTASLNPNGYLAHEPMHADNGTITPTGALASMPYQPELVMQMMETMYLQYGEMLWGPFGFYDAFNFSRNWVADGYIGIDVGPIAPMIENHRSGKLWEIFMRAPEINTAIEKVWNHPDAMFKKQH
ncbi:MAG: glucoamylase family protein [Lentimonas sp.]